MHTQVSRVTVLMGILSLASLSAGALSNRVFLGLNGNNVADCANPATPCATFAGAMAQVNAGGEIVIEASGGYGPLTITQAVTINSAAGVVGYSGSTVTINAPGASVVLRGLTIDSSGATANGIEVTAVGQLHVEDCRISNFTGDGIHLGVAAQLFLKNTDIKGTLIGVEIDNTAGTSKVSVEDCRFDGNLAGFRAATTAPGASITTAIQTRSNGNAQYGWICGAGTNGQDVLQLESCTGSGNNIDGLLNNSANAASVTRYSNCVFANNGRYGVNRESTGTIETRSNSSLTGNISMAINGVLFGFNGQ